MKRGELKLGETQTELVELKKASEQKNELLQIIKDDEKEPKE